MGKIRPSKKIDLKSRLTLEREVKQSDAHKAKIEDVKRIKEHLKTVTNGAIPRGLSFLRHNAKNIPVGDIKKVFTNYILVEDFLKNVAKISGWERVSNTVVKSYQIDHMQKYIDGNLQIFEHLVVGMNTAKSKSEYNYFFKILKEYTSEIMSYKRTLYQTPKSANKLNMIDEGVNEVKQSLKRRFDNLHRAIINS